MPFRQVSRQVTFLATGKFAQLRVLGLIGCELFIQAVSLAAPAAVFTVVDVSRHFKRRVLPAGRSWSAISSSLTERRGTPLYRLCWATKADNGHTNQRGFVCSARASMAALIASGRDVSRNDSQW